MVSVYDAHVHVVSSDTERFALQRVEFGRDWWTGRDVDAVAVRSDLDAAGIDGAVVVQAVGPYRNDNRYAHEVVAASEGHFALVAAIDPEGHDPGSEFEAVANLGGVAGIRVSAFRSEAAWATDSRGRDIWAAARATNTSIVVACLAHHLADIATLADAFPDVSVAIDHCGFPDISGGERFPHAAPLFALAAIPSIALKVTTIVLQEAQGHGGTRALVNELNARFGAHRLCWGSDHPQTYELPYPEMVQLALDATVDLPSSDRAAFLADTTRALWFERA